MPSKGSSAVQPWSATPGSADEAEQAALLELGQARAGAAAGGRFEVGPSSWGGDPEIELDLADLLSDRNGEVVVFNDSAARTLGIATDAAVVADGPAAPHVTAGGADVTGYRFVTFDNGLTVYFEDGLDLVVRSAGERPSGGAPLAAP